jgi:regulator of sigma E protease
MPYLLAFLGFAALIILHEFGHFAAAKAVGMRVERFSLFFGPLVVKKQIGETEYGVGPIPLGGYVRITGMNPHEEIPPEAIPRAYYNQPVWKRIVVILAGPAMNLLIAFVIVWALFATGGADLGKLTGPNAVVSVQAHSVAATVLKPGDQFVTINGVRATESSIRNEISSDRCAGAQVNGCVAAKPVTMVIRRDGHEHTVLVRPRYDAKAKRMLVGFEFGPTTVGYGAAAAVPMTFRGLWHVTTKTVSTVAQIFKPKARSQLHGVVYGYTATEQSFSHSPALALEILALISLSLAIINLFPFLPLDGGHVFWALAEKVRGKRIPFEVMERASAIGFVLIIIVFVIGLSNDISALSGPGLGIR